MSYVQILLLLTASFAAAALLTKCLIPWLKKLKFGQNIREDGPKAHLAKQGTPTMGGIAMVLGGTLCFLTALFVRKAWSAEAWIVLLGFVGFGTVGFLDDYLKIRKKENEGLTVKQKFALEILLAVVIALLRVFSTPAGSTLWIPFVKIEIDLGLFAVPFIVFIVVAMTNAVNLTDGLDGLASSVTAVVSAFFAFAAGALNGSFAGGAFAIVLAGVTLGFLTQNRHPAKVFMGDTGSLSLGGALAGIALVSGTELLLPFAGLVYVAEALSVILQVAYFKRTHGKRLFRMAPLHHHFELGGWSETKVVCIFTVVTMFVCGIALLGIVL